MNQKKGSLIENKLNKVLLLTKGKYREAYEIFEELLLTNNNATNKFNVMINAIYCGEYERGKRLYEELRFYTPNLKTEPMKLSSCFIRFYYALALVSINKKEEAISILDYLIDVISKHKITDSTYLYIRGIPPVELVVNLIEELFKNDNSNKEVYMQKLVSVVDNETKKSILDMNKQH